MERAATQQAEVTMAKTVEKKLEDMTKGEGVPSNAEVSESLEKMKPGYDISREHLSDTGRELTEQLDKLVEDTRRIFLDKNKDEDLQKAAVHASRAAQIARRHQLLSSEEGKRAMEEAKKGVYSGVNFARLMVTSTEFRDELVDILGVIQQSLRRGGTSAPRRTGTSVTEAGHPFTTTTTGAESPVTEEEESEEEDFYDTNRESDQPGLGEKVKEKLGIYEPLSENQLDKIAHRFLKLVKRLQSRPEYQDSIRYLIERMRNAFQMGSLHAERMEQQLGESSEGRAFLDETAQAKDHAIRLIERWTEASLEPLFNQLNGLNEQMKNDEETRRELSGIGSFVESNLKGAQLQVDEQTMLQEAKDRFQRVRERLLTHYNERSNRVLEELEYIRDTFRENEAAQVLQQDVNALIKTILYDEQGQPTVKVELVKDLEVLFSAFLRKVQFVPVPRVAVTNPDFDLIIDDLVVNIRELTPKQIHTETITRVHDSELQRAGQSAREGTETTSGADTSTGVAAQEHPARKQERSSSWTGSSMTSGSQAEPSKEPIHLATFVRLHLKEIHSDLRNVKWYFNKKTGMFKEHDRGLADIKIYGPGMSIDLDVEPGLPIATKEKPVGHTIEVKRAKCKIHKMSLRLYDSKHDFLYTMFKPFIKSRIRSAIEQSVEQYMVEYIKNLDKNATISATGQYPVTLDVTTHMKHKEMEARQRSSAEGGPSEMPVVEPATEEPA